MEVHPKVSILIPVYNTARYLPACMASVLNQTLKEIEIIVVNDASPDNAAEVLAEYAAQDSRIKVITHEKNGGILAARLSGIAAAAGEYLIFLDADDYLNTDTARACYAKARKTGADMIHFCFDVRIGHQKKNHFARKVEKRINPYRGKLLGKQVFEGAFVNYLYSWNICGKFIAADICRKAAAALPPGYYIMAEDFCFYTMMSWFAVHYEPLFMKCYHYGLDIGVSNYARTDYQGFIRNCTVFTALNAVKTFLSAHGGWNRYRSAFEEQERRILNELLERWEKKLIRYDRVRALSYMFENYSREGLMRSFISYFAGRENVLGQLMGMPEIFQKSTVQPEDRHVGLYLENAVTGEEFTRQLVRCATEWQNGGIKVTVISPADNALILPSGMNRIQIPAGLTSMEGDLLARGEFWFALREKYGINTVVHGAAEPPELIFDMLALKLAGQNLIAAPLTGLHMLADSSMGHFTARMRALLLADAMMVQSNNDSAFFSAFGKRCGIISMPRKDEVFPEKNQEKRTRLLWIGHFGDPDAEMVLSVWEKLARQFPDWTLCMVGRTRTGISDRVILTMADSMHLNYSLEVCLNPADFTGQLQRCGLFFMTSGSTDCQLYAEAAKAAGIPCLLSQSPTSEALAEELSGILNGCRKCSAVPDRKTASGIELFRSQTAETAGSRFPAEDLLEILDSYQLKFEPYVLLPKNRGESFIRLYRKIDELVYRILPAESARRDWSYRVCRFILNRLRKKKAN